MLFNDLQPRKEDDPIDFTEDGIVICSSDEHSLKVLSSIDVTDDGLSNKNNFKDLQPRKDDDPIDFTDDGIVIFSSDEQPSKTLYPIDVTEEGIMICVNDEHS